VSNDSLMPMFDGYLT